MAHFHSASHEERPDRDSGVRRHRKPYFKQTRCLRTQFPKSKRTDAALKAQRAAVRYIEE